jgi:calcium-independent phospholipase A2-gamma
MLGRLEMTIDQCIDAFTSMMGSIFDQKKKDRLPFKWYSGKVNHRYDSKTLENAIKKVIESAGLHSDTLMRGTKKSACKVYRTPLITPQIYISSHEASNLLPTN